jgi:hypothetical protein
MPVNGDRVIDRARCHFIDDKLTVSFAVLKKGAGFSSTATDSPALGLRGHLHGKNRHRSLARS